MPKAALKVESEDTRIDARLANSQGQWQKLTTTQDAKRRPHQGRAAKNDIQRPRRRGPSGLNEPGDFWEARRTTSCTKNGKARLYLLNSCSIHCVTLASWSSLNAIP
jgi:hypothetical protein